ncbi:hypothetical protein Y032_0143g2378 [Ancylostoma ceylanicum]|uniref:Uncharacterized protein n=1 Tax=Ancylostoma ceylanicum TaxID=53326 RepID=A0A016T299_9BILA|nr:hypothetical protein Y032_0143g2378 [Ancylostoma ceylanicum]
MSSVAEALRSVLSSASTSTEVGTAFMSLASTIDQVFNLPLPFGVGKGQALQNLLEKLGYGKPLFDHDRDLLASDMIFVNRNGSTCNLSVSGYVMIEFTSAYG